MLVTTKSLLVATTRAQVNANRVYILALIMKLFLQDINNLARKSNKIIIFLQDLIKILQGNYLAIFLARFLQDFLYLARKASYLVQDLQDLMQNPARKILAR